MTTAAADTAARLRATVDLLCDPLHPRTHQHPRHLMRLAAGLEEDWREAGMSTAMQPFTLRSWRYVNVVARGGRGSGPPLVVGAHYDAHVGTPGADDNASGVAVISEVARAWGRDPPPIPVEVVAWTLEEEPYFGTPDMGSAHHARWLAANGGARLVMALDMVGVFSDVPGSQRYPLPLMKYLWPRTGNFLAVVAGMGDYPQLRRLAGTLSSPRLPFVAMTAPSFVAGVLWSDHRSFWNVGIPAVLLSDTAFYRHDRYHAAADEPATLDYARMALAVEALVALPWNLGAATMAR